MVGLCYAPLRLELRVRYRPHIRHAKGCVCLRSKLEQARKKLRIGLRFRIDFRKKLVTIFAEFDLVLNTIKSRKGGNG